MEMTEGYSALAADDPTARIGACLIDAQHRALLIWRTLGVQFTDSLETPRIYGFVGRRTTLHVVVNSLLQRGSPIRDKAFIGVARSQS